MLIHKTRLIGYSDNSLGRGRNWRRGGGSKLINWQFSNWSVSEVKNLSQFTHQMEVLFKYHELQTWRTKDNWLPKFGILKVSLNYSFYVGREKKITFIKVCTVHSPNAEVNLLRPFTEYESLVFWTLSQ